jgi:hypothetical protein
MSVDAVLGNRVGSIVAPAGCGKTHLITDVLAVPQDKPYLVLTHTTAGVAALKTRLANLDIPKSNYRIQTVDGWALKLARMFPLRSGFSVPASGVIRYPALQSAAAQLCSNGDLFEVLQETYSRLLVDEYQDCNADQHRSIVGLSRCLPTSVFGDPMQTLFNFKQGTHPSWNLHVETVFPRMLELTTPWRWNNALEPEFGQWVLGVRSEFMAGRKIDLRMGPKNVTWIQKPQEPQEVKKLQLVTQQHIRRDMAAGETMLVIGDSSRAESRHGFARDAAGIGVVERVDLPDLLEYTQQIEGRTPAEVLELTLEVVSSLMTGVDRSILSPRVKTILLGRNRTPPSKVESAACSLATTGSNTFILELFHQLEAKPGTRIYRGAAYYALKDAINTSLNDESLSLHSAMTMVRERRRHAGERRIPQLAIGSTLLLKGLEADHVLILDTRNSYGYVMNRDNLYVALSRGAKSITVISESPLLG